MATDDVSPADAAESGETPGYDDIRAELDRRRLRRRLLMAAGVVVLLSVVIKLTGFLDLTTETLLSQRARNQFGKFVAGLFPPNFEDLTHYTKANEIGGLSALITAFVHIETGSVFGLQLPMPSILVSLTRAEAGNGNVIVSAAYVSITTGLTGTVLGFPLALTFGVLGSERVVRFPFNFIFRGVMSTIRAIPAIVWVLIYIPIFGVSPATGVLAITTDTIGNLGRLFAEELEEIDEGPIEAVRSAGGNKPQTVAFGMLSQVTNGFIAWTLYILEINTRIAITLGVLGVGGLGMYIDQQRAVFNFPKMTAGIITIIVIVISIEMFSSRVRARLRPDQHTGKGLVEAITDLFEPTSWTGTGGGAYKDLGQRKRFDPSVDDSGDDEK